MVGSVRCVVEFGMGKIGLGRGADAMFEGFGIVHLDSVVGEIQVLDSQGNGLAHSKPGTIHALGIEVPRGL